MKVSQRLNTAWARAVKSEPLGSPAQLLPEQPRLAGRVATEGSPAPAPALALDVAMLLLFPGPPLHAFPWQKVFQGQKGGLDLPPSTHVHLEVHKSVLGVSVHVCVCCLGTQGNYS